MKNQPRKPILTLLTLAALASVASGCAVTAASTGLGVAYAKGNIETFVAASPEEVKTAAEAAFEELGVELVAVESSPGQLRVVGWLPEGKKVKVKVQPRGTEASKVYVRVGVFGNQQLRHQVYGQLMAELGTAAGGAPTTAATGE